MAHSRAMPTRKALGTSTSVHHFPKIFEMLLAHLTASGFDDSKCVCKIFFDLINIYYMHIANEMLKNYIKGQK